MVAEGVLVAIGGSWMGRACQSDREAELCSYLFKVMGPGVA